MTNIAAVVISDAVGLLMIVLRIDNSATSNYDAAKMPVIKDRTNELLTSGVDSEYSRTPLIRKLVIRNGLALRGKHFRTVIVLHLFMALIPHPPIVKYM